MTAWHIPTPDPRWALFLDVDGTLLEFKAEPGAVRADTRLRALLENLSRALDGALALVSGRSLAMLDTIFAPLALPAAGLHGLEIRHPGLAIDREPIRVPARVHRELAALVEPHPGLLLEDKGGTIALHYRLAPERESLVHAAMERLARELGPTWVVQPGACVAELKPAARTKGTALETFMREAPFAGRRPVYLGDDYTDEYGFEAALRLGGEAIAVGPRVSTRWHLPDPAATRQWLAAVLAAVERERAAS